MNTAIAEQVTLSLFKGTYGVRSCSLVDLGRYPQSATVYCRVLQTMAYQQRTKIFAWIAGTGIAVFFARMVYHDILTHVNMKRKKHTKKPLRRRRIMNVHCVSNSNSLEPVQHTLENQSEYYHQDNVEHVDHVESGPTHPIVIFAYDEANNPDNLDETISNASGDTQHSQALSNTSRESSVSVSSSNVVLEGYVDLEVTESEETQNQNSGPTVEKPVLDPWLDGINIHSSSSSQSNVL